MTNGKSARPKFRRIDDMALNRNLLKRLEIHKENSGRRCTGIGIRGSQLDGVNFHPRVKSVITTFPV